jgi:hypothetical protein
MAFNIVQDTRDTWVGKVTGCMLDLQANLRFFKNK